MYNVESNKGWYHSKNYSTMRLAMLEYRSLVKDGYKARVTRLYSFGFKIIKSNY